MRSALSFPSSPLKDDDLRHTVIAFIAYRFTVNPGSRGYAPCVFPPDSSRLNDPGPSSLRTLPDETKKRLLASSSSQGTDKAVRFANLWRRLESSVRNACVNRQSAFAHTTYPLTRPRWHFAASYSCPERSRCAQLAPSLLTCSILPQTINPLSSSYFHQSYIGPWHSRTQA